MSALGSNADQQNSQAVELSSLMEDLGLPSVATSGTSRAQSLASGIKCLHVRKTQDAQGAFSGDLRYSRAHGLWLAEIRAKKRAERSTESERLGNKALKVHWSGQRLRSGDCVDSHTGKEADREPQEQLRYARP